MMSRSTKAALLTTAALSITSPLFAGNGGQLRYVYDDNGNKHEILPGEIESSQIITETRRVNLHALQAEANIKNPKPTTKSVATKVNDCGRGTEFKIVPVNQPTYEDRLVDAEQTVKRIDTSTKYKGGFATFGITSRERGFLTTGEDVYFDAVVGSNDLYTAKLGQVTNSATYWDAFMTPLGHVVSTAFQFGTFRYHGLPSDNYSYNMNNSSASEVGNVSAETGAITNTAKTGPVTTTQNNDQTQVNKQDQNAYLSSWTNVEQELTAKINSTNIAKAEADANAVNNPYRQNQSGCKRDKWGNTFGCHK